MKTHFKLTPLALTLAASMVASGTAMAGCGTPAIANAAAQVKVGQPGAGSVITNGTVLLVWAGDANTLLGRQNMPLAFGRDFLAVVDAEPYSCDYGKVIWTANVASLAVSNIPPGGVVGALDSATHNDPHHQLAYTSYIDPATRRKFVHLGGVISKNVFRFDITSVRGGIDTADAVVCGTQPRQSSLTDDFVVMPNGNIIYTYMGSLSYGGNLLGEGLPEGGGTVTEINPMRTAPALLGLICTPFALGGSTETIGNVDTYLGEYQVAPKNGPSSFVPRESQNSTDTQAIRNGTPNKGVFYLGNKNAAKEADPHGMALTYDGVYLAASDYAVPVSIGGAAANLVTQLLGTLLGQNSKLATFSTFGTSVRVMRVNPATINAPAFDSYTLAAGEGTGYFKPPTITYGGAESGMNALAGAPNGPVAAYMQSISVVPDGPRMEQVAFHEENEALMAFGLPHQAYHCPDQAGWNPGADTIFGNGDDGTGDALCAPAVRIPHHGGYTNSMCGGTMFYTPNIRLPQSANGGAGPLWNAIYDVGPCSGVSYNGVIDDDRFMFQPISGIEPPIAEVPVFDRDYKRQHSRRMIIVDLRPLGNQGNGISSDANADGEANELDLAAGATYTHPIECHFPTRSNATAGGNLGLPLAASVDRVITPGMYAAETGTPYAASLNILIHNNLKSDCPRVLGVVGQMENGVSPTSTTLGQPLAAGVATVGDGADPGVPMLRAVPSGNGGLLLSAAEMGGHPTAAGTGNLNTPQNIVTAGGPHFSNFDRIGFCVPTGAVSGVATCKGGSYYDLRPELTGSPRNVYPASPAAAAACRAGTSAYNGTEAGSTAAAAVDTSCVVRVGFIQYFVELGHVPAPGTGSDGDRTMCMMLVNRVTGAATLDPSFKDELKGLPCMDWDSAARAAYTWPGARGADGGAKPHTFSFERDGANAIGPGYFPPASLNLDGVP